MNTIDGEVKIVGTAFLEMKVFNITERVAIFNIDPKACKHDFILRLDLILVPTFKLNLNHELKLTQSSPEKNKNMSVDNHNNNVDSLPPGNNNNPLSSSDGNNNRNNVSFSPSDELKDNNNPIAKEVNFNKVIVIELFEAKLDHLNSDKKKILENLVDEFGAVFAKDAYDVDMVKDIEACIVIHEDCIITKKPYRCLFEDHVDTPGSGSFK